MNFVWSLGKSVSAADSQIERKWQFMEELPCEVSAVANPKFVGAQMPSATFDSEEYVVFADPRIYHDGRGFACRNTYLELPGGIGSLGEGVSYAKKHEYY